MQSARRSGRLSAEREPGELLAWDSEFWGMRIGRVRGSTLERDAVDAWAEENAVDCIYFLAADEPGAAVHAEDVGFRLMDVRIELERPAEGDEHSTLRRARPEDRDRLLALARENHRITRFYSDPRFPDDHCDDLYEAWMANSLDGWAAAVLVPDRPGGAAAYVTCHVDEATSSGSIGLIGVAPEARGRGLGHELVAGAVAWCRDSGQTRVTVVTQTRNVPALRMFESSGFRTEAVALWFHKWYDR